MSQRDLRTARNLEEPITLPYQTVLEAMQRGEIIEEIGLMRAGSNYTFLVRIEHQTEQVLAVYKPRLGERPLWDFPDGTLCQRETAAFVVSDALRWMLVPPTVLREGPRGEGSIQAFIDHDPRRHYFTLDENHDSQLQVLAAFDAIINNADRKGGHCLLDADDHIWGIDHGLGFHHHPKLRTVIWDYAGQDMPETILGDLDQLCQQLHNPDSPLSQELCGLLSTIEVKALIRRVTTLIAERTYPLPGSGPNRPWPAI